MDPWLGEIRLFACTFVPRGWLACDGSLLSISANTALYALLGTQFGGNGVSNFGLPNLNGSTAVGAGQGIGLSAYPMGSTFGSATVTLGPQQMAAHTHSMPAGAPGISGVLPSPTTYLSAAPSSGIHNPAPPVYATPAVQATSAVTMASTEAGSAGGNQAHNNMSPYLALKYCIASQGLFPPRQ